MPKFKKMVLTYCKLFDKFISKLNKDQKTSFLKFEKNFYVNVKTIYGLYFPFAINFMFELKMSFRKKLVMTSGLIWLSCYIPTFF